MDLMTEQETIRSQKLIILVVESRVGALTATQMIPPGQGLDRGHTARTGATLMILDIVIAPTVVHLGATVEVDLVIDTIDVDPHHAEVVEVTVIAAALLLAGQEVALTAGREVIVALVHVLELGGAVVHVHLVLGGN